jgi:hypothetical protein
MTEKLVRTVITVFLSTTFRRIFSLLGFPRRSEAKIGEIRLVFFRRDSGLSTLRRILSRYGETRARCQAVQQWINVFYRQPDHLPRVRATTDWTCAVRTQRDRCEAMCKHNQAQDTVDTDH